MFGTYEGVCIISNKAYSTYEMNMFEDHPNTTMALLHSVAITEAALIANIFLSSIQCSGSLRNLSQVNFAHLIQVKSECLLKVSFYQEV